MPDSAEIRDFLTHARNILAALLAATSRLREEGADGFALEVTLRTPSDGVLTMTLDSGSADEDDEDASDGSDE